MVKTKNVYFISHAQMVRDLKTNYYEIWITVDRLPKLTEDKFSGSCNAIGSTNPVESTKAEMTTKDWKGSERCKAKYLVI